MKAHKPDPFIESLDLLVKTRLGVASEYEITEKTLIRRLKKNGVILPPGLIFPITCKKIYYTLGIPAGLKEKVHNELNKND